MKRIAGLLAVTVLAIGAPSAPADEKADDWKKLAGTWKPESITLNGQDATAAFKAIVLTIEEGKYKVDVGGMADAGTVTLDPAKKPKQMAITGTDGPNKGKTIHAIYEIDGDRLKVCYALEAKEAPKEFKSTEENKTMLVSYKRDKK
jgi:uncharacterized protein (TIGR03067 family)